MSSTFLLFKDGLYNLLGYIIITTIFFFPSSCIILIYESIRKLHSPLLRERLYIMATELGRTLCSAPLPSPETLRQVWNSYLYTYYYYFYIFIFLPASEAASAPPGAGWVRAGASLPADGEQRLRRWLQHSCFFQYFWDVLLVAETCDFCGGSS